MMRRWMQLPDPLHVFLSATLCVGMGVVDCATCRLHEIRSPMYLMLEFFARNL